MSPANSVATNTTSPLPSVVGATLRMRWPAKVSRASSVQVAPPSMERARPTPGLPYAKKLLVLPVPANSVLGFTGLNARELMEISGSWQPVSGVQAGLAAVALVVFQTPPFTDPT